MEEDVSLYSFEAVMFRGPAKQDAFTRAATHDFTHDEVDKREVKVVEEL
jgi:hypothetical protein